MPNLAPLRLFERGAYQISFGKGAALIRVAALNRSFTVPPQELFDEVTQSPKL